jgi:hypothetical protein
MPGDCCAPIREAGPSFAMDDAPGLTAGPGGNRPAPATKHPAGHTASPPRLLPTRGPATSRVLRPPPKQTGGASGLPNDLGLTVPP